jgi:PhoPQ-activated pathogenicity-related protein
MIDPYSYRKTLAMPKMIFMGTNDPYWPVDAVKNYIDSIPGDNNICYTPNTGHDLGGGRVAMMTLSAFLGLIANDMQIPPCDYQIVQNEGDISLKVISDPAQLQKAILWSSVSEDQDFRDETWADSVLQVPKDNINVKIGIPASGYRAFYVDLLYKAPSGEDYTQSTRMFVSDSIKLLLK